MAAIELPKNLWVIVHRHEYGASCYLAQHPKEPSEDEAAALIAAEGSSFEPERDEQIDVFRADEAVVLAQAIGRRPARRPR